MIEWSVVVDGNLVNIDVVGNVFKCVIVKVGICGKEVVFVIFVSLMEL